MHFIHHFMPGVKPAFRLKGTPAVLHAAADVEAYRRRQPPRRDGRLHSPALTGPTTAMVRDWLGFTYTEGGRA
jgi:hypothetical protein